MEGKGGERSERKEFEEEGGWEKMIEGERKKKGVE